MPPRKDSSSDDLPPTVSEQLSQLIAATNAASTQQATQLSDLIKATQNLNTKIDQLSDHITSESSTFTGSKTPPVTRPPLHTTSQPNSNPRPPKITLPLFDGSNALDWIFQAENYFSYYQIPEAQRLSLAVFYFIGDALSWYKHLANNELLGTWTTFKRELELRFGPSTYENHEATLFKLRQSSTVSAYQTEFERVSNRVVGLSQQALRNCFISGLRSDIQNELAILQPTTLHQAYALARLVEEKLQQLPKPKATNNSKPTSSWTTPPTFPPANPTPPTTNPTSSSPLLPTPTKTPQNLPFTKLSAEALQQRRKDGLCFKCPEKYFPGHKCSPPQFLLIVDNDDSDDMLPDQSDPNHATLQSPQFLSLSHAAFFGLSSTQTLRVTGHIDGKPVTILVDCGSTHNIIQPRIAAGLKLPTKPISPFSVMVGNGQHISCKDYCPDVKLQLQKSFFEIPFFVLPVEGADVILGVAWLGTLGRLTADFSIPELSFYKDGRLCTLQGEPLGTPVSPSSLSTLLKHGSISSLHTMLFDSLPNDQPTVVNPLSHADPHIASLLGEFKCLFEPPKGLPPNRPHDHHIPLFPGAAPANVKPYRYPHFQKEIMTRLITEMLNEGVIRPSQSPFSSPVLLVKKKDGSWRFCVDYRSLNSITIKDRFPIPTIDELLDELHGATIFSKIDLRSGYHQIRVADKDIHKTAFRTTDGHYEFLVMPFGLTNAPSTFQSAMNDLFRSVLRRFVLVFFDDILIYSDTHEQHYSHLKYVFETLLHHKFHAKPSKCVFGVQEVSFLGHRISFHGVSSEPDQIASIKQWPQPVSFTTLRAFLGLTGYYRRFVPQYAKTAAALTDILKQKSFTWSQEAQQAFISLKTHMEKLVTLALPDFSKPFEVTTDASGVAIGAVLSQNNRPISFFSKKLCSTMQGQSTYTKELYAITEAVKKWRQYLLGRRFRIYTDHHSLKHLFSQTIQTPEQQKWATKLLGYDFEVIYKPGRENLVADALSRVDVPAVFSFSHPTAPWLNEIRTYFATSENGQQLVAQIMEDPSAFPHHKFKDGLVYVHGKVLVPPINSLRSTLLAEFHSSYLGGHAGINGTTKRLSSAFSWVGLKKDVTSFVKACEVCQAIKPSNHKPYGLLQPLPTPEAPWLDISMDFVTNLPSSRGKTVIWVVVDRLSKFAHFLSLPTHYTAAFLATLFLREIYRLHGLPNTIVSDRDPIFISRFWRELFKQLGTKLLHSSAYHPQTDGQTEVVNRCLESYLRAFVFDEPSTWERYLYMAEFSYNTSFHSSINMTPFKAVYGRDATTIHEYSSGDSKNASIDSSLMAHQHLLQGLKQSMEHSKERMVKQANKKRTEKEFQVGEYVYLRLQDYRQKSVEERKNHKLSRRFFGPYEIVERIGKVAYKLALPEGSKIHPVFHVSLLKQCYGRTTSASGDLNNFSSVAQLERVDFNPIDIILGGEDATEVQNKNPLCFYDVLADHFASEPDERGKPILDYIVQLWSQPFASHIFALLFHKWLFEVQLDSSDLLLRYSSALVQGATNVFWIDIQTNTTHFRSLFRFLLDCVALVPEKLKKIPLQAQRDLFLLLSRFIFLYNLVEKLDSFFQNFPEFPNAFLVGGPADIFVIELTDQLQKLKVEPVLLHSLSQIKVLQGLELRMTTSTRLKTCLYSFTSPGGPMYPTRAVRHAAWDALDFLFPVGRYPRHIISLFFRLLYPWYWPSSCWNFVWSCIQAILHPVTRLVFPNRELRDSHVS